MSKPGQELQIDFTGKLHNEKLSGETQILIAIDRFSKWPTAKVCKTSETKEVTNFLSSYFKFVRNTGKDKIRQRGSIHFKEYRQFCKSRNIEIEYCTHRMHTGNGVVERAIQTIKNLIIANVAGGLCLTEAKSGTTSNAFHNTYGIKNNTV